MLRKLLLISNEEKGATAIEYSLIAALIAMVIVGAVTAVGLAVTGNFNSVAAAL